MKKYKIVIVEDNEDERAFMTRGLVATGLFEIMAQVRNGDDLIDWLTDQTLGTFPDFLLSDLNMPGKNGYDILDFVKAHSVYSRIPVIVISTSRRKLTVNKCLEKGAAYHLPKPDTFLEYTPFGYELHQLVRERQLVN